MEPGEDVSTRSRGNAVPYCELWMEMRSGNVAFRVALLVPVGFDVPIDLKKLKMRDAIADREFYVSRWFPEVLAAKHAMDDVARYYAERRVKFLFFREIRPITATLA